jgi:2-polyprenyl-3-methyl-5-hydroxy-6-metoxy-1,4-benzoquinol methylase
VGRIRSSECNTLLRLVDQTVYPDDRVLEIGPGTGYYTVHLARRAAHVTAVEQSPQMVQLLQWRLAQEGLDNCCVMNFDFMRMPREEPFDVVALMGVLDYVDDPAAFLDCAAALTRRALLFTTPRRGFLASLHWAGNALRGVRVHTYVPEQLRSYLPGFILEVRETGHCSRLWRGMTLACRAVRG